MRVGYVGLTCAHLNQRVDEHKGPFSSNGEDFQEKHLLIPKDLSQNFSVLKKCTNKFDCLVYKMLFINKRKPSLNVQSDSIFANVFK